MVQGILRKTDTLFMILGGQYLPIQKVLTGPLFVFLRTKKELKVAFKGVRVSAILESIYWSSFTKHFLYTNRVTQSA